MNNIHAFECGLSKKVNEVPGFFFDNDRGKWASYLYRNNKNIFCGRFLTKEDAINARNRKLDDIENKTIICK
ncbi:putative homing endonuclease [Vibrio phage vB_Vp_PvVp04_M]|nr:putative homing endonuclease [Vibrio phage vB_Vp_PvVp04_M]